MISADHERHGVFQPQPSDFGWWCWLASAILLAVWLSGVEQAYWLLLALSGFQVAWFRLRKGRSAAFPVQVRVAFLMLIAGVGWEPLHGLAYLPAIGTWAQALFGYCALARTLSLTPWNRRQPLTWDLVWRTYAAPPTTGRRISPIA